MDDDNLVLSACREIIEYTKDRKSVLIFASGVRHGQHICRVMGERHKVECGFVCGETLPFERDEVLRRFSEYKRKRGDRVGLNWRIPVVTGKRATRHVVFDTNYWKSFVHARLTVPMGDPGCLSLFGRKPEAHRMLADHLTSEYRVKTEGRGRTVDEWKLRVEGLDNHWLDCLVGSAVAASIQGAILFGTDARPAPRPRMRLSDLQRGRR